jgi:aminoglycoside phosphotransferase (APT) family kinase protein
MTSTSELQSRLRVYCYLQFEQYEKIELEAVTPISSNAESSVYSFVMRYEERGGAKSDALIVKIFSDDMLGKDRTLKERHALKQLHYRGYPVPRPLASEIDAGHIGAPFIIMERVAGRLLGDVLSDTPELEQNPLLTDFVQLLVDLHTMNLKALVDNLLLKGEYTLIKRELYNLKSLVSGHDALNPILDWLNTRRDAVPCKRPSINHRDFHPWNVLQDEDGKLSVIDWGWQISDPRSDLGWMLAKFEREEMASRAAYVLKEYERLNDAPVEELAYFKVLANLRWITGVAKDLQVNRALQNGASSRVHAHLQPRLRLALEMIQGATDLALPSAETLLSSFKAG